MSNESGRGITPRPQDVLAVAILVATYTVRLGQLGSPSNPLPWWLSLTTDAILPTMAGAWLFVTAFFVILVRTGEL